MEPSPKRPEQPKPIPKLTRSTQAYGSHSLTIPSYEDNGERKTMGRWEAKLLGAD
jgi:hypothetical protein